MLEKETEYQRRENCTDEGLEDRQRGPLDFSAEYYLYTQNRKQAETRRKPAGKEGRTIARPCLPDWKDLTHEDG